MNHCLTLKQLRMYFVVYHNQFFFTFPLEKTLMLGKTEGKRRRGQQRLSWLDNITDSMLMNLSKY